MPGDYYFFSYYSGPHETPCFKSFFLPEPQNRTFYYCSKIHYHQFSYHNALDYFMISICIDIAFTTFLKIS